MVALEGIRMSNFQNNHLFVYKVPCLPPHIYTRTHHTASEILCAAPLRDVRCAIRMFACWVARHHQLVGARHADANGRDGPKYATNRNYFTLNLQLYDLRKARHSSGYCGGSSRQSSGRSSCCMLNN